MHPIYDVLYRQVQTDIKQMEEEGHDPAALTAELEKAAAGKSLAALAKFQEELWSRPSPAGFGYEEPSDWESIAATFPAPVRTEVDDATLRDRLLGGWLGRCAGCQCGKPLEGTAEPAEIRRVLQKVGSWPLEDYPNPTTDAMMEEGHRDNHLLSPKATWRREHSRGSFRGASADDDIQYALSGQSLLEKFGTGFTLEDDKANFVTRMNIGLWASGEWFRNSAKYGIPLDAIAQMGNPARQSLGAMIRCDPFGWGAAGDPALAASMAWRDAFLSQRRNGIYAAMFFAVLIADVLGHGDIGRAIATAQSYVPPRSRLAEMIRLVVDGCAAGKDWAAVNEAMQAKYPEESRRFNHSIPNTGIVLIGLLCGGGDFTKTVGITVMCGLDTDCTGATAGSIMGCALGAKKIPAHWTEPLADTIRVGMGGWPATVKISDQAEQMFQIVRRSQAARKE